MPVTREARYLSGVDRGKHVRLMVPGGRYTGPQELEGELLAVAHWGDGTIALNVLRADGPRRAECIPPNTIVTITGKPS